MGAGLFKAPAKNYISTSLNGSIDDSATTITLTSTTNLQSPGYIVIDREDGNNNATPNSREVVKYTGISGSDLTGCTRAADGSTARSHSDGALVETMLTVGMWNDQYDMLTAEHAVNGTHTIISSTTITTANVGSLSADNITGVRGQFVWTKAGSLATVRAAVASDSHMPLLRASQNLTINDVWLSLSSFPSTAPVEVDVSYSANPTGTWATIFSTRPFIDVGEYDTGSSATGGTLSLTSLASGTYLRAEVLQHGNAYNLTVSLPATSRK